MNDYLNYYPTVGRQEPRQYSYFFFFYIGEAYNWLIAPGSLLVFKDQDNIHFYTKSLGYSPYDKPIFEVFTREAQAQEQKPDSDFELLKKKVAELESKLSEIKVVDNNRNNNNNKGGNH